MASDSQARQRLSSTSPDFGAGRGAAERFPFVVLQGGEEKGPVNPIFQAYVRREVPAGWSARQALVAALAERDEEVSGKSSAKSPSAKADYSSYGVTAPTFPVRGDQARVVKPVRAAQAPEPRVEVETSPARSVERPSPLLKRSVPALAPDPLGAPAGGEGAGRGGVPVGGTATISDAVRLEPSGAAPGTVKLKLMTRRDAGTQPPMPFAPASLAPPQVRASVTLPPANWAPPAPQTPRAQAPANTGLAMDGIASPLMPIGGLVAAPGGDMTAPVAPMPGARFTSAPFVPAGAGSGLAGRTQPSFPVGRVGPVTARRESGTGGGRVAMAAGLLVLLAVVVYGWTQRESLLARMTGVVASAIPAGPVAPAAGGPVAGASEPVAAVTPQEPTRGVAAATNVAARPAPTAEFRGIVERFKITGVVQGAPVRAIIDGRLVKTGDLVDAKRDIRLVGQDVAARRLIFEDRNTAQTSARY